MSTEDAARVRAREIVDRMILRMKAALTSDWKVLNTRQLRSEVEEECEALAALRERVAGLEATLAEIIFGSREKEDPRGHQRAREDGTERLCQALYGRKAAPRDYLGGSEAHMLHDAADQLTALRERVARLEAVLREILPRYCEMFEAAGLGNPLTDSVVVPTALDLLKEGEKDAPEQES